MFCGFIFGIKYIILFDMVIINKGNGYYFSIGVFIVFEFGYYVFIWIVCMIFGFEYLLELVVNSLVKGVLFMCMYDLED